MTVLHLKSVDNHYTRDPGPSLNPLREAVAPFEGEGARLRMIDTHGALPPRLGPERAMTFRLFAPAALAAVLTAGPALAHHSFAMYDRERIFTLTGTVKDYEWASPHVVIEVVKDDPKGGLVTWWIEGGAPTVLARGGWTSTLIKPGDKISLGVHPRKDGQPGGLLADEQQLLINGHAPKGVLWLMPPGEETCGAVGGK
jgi:hypothetical protein